MVAKATENMMVKGMNIIKRFLICICLLVSVELFGFTPFVSAEKPPENILKNGDFDLNLEGWHHWTHADAAALFQTEGKKAEPVVGKKVAYVKISKAGARYGTSNSISNLSRWRKVRPILTTCGRKAKNRELS